MMVKGTDDEHLANILRRLIALHSDYDGAHIHVEGHWLTLDGFFGVEITDDEQALVQRLWEEALQTGEEKWDEEHTPPPSGNPYGQVHEHGRRP